MMDKKTIQTINNRQEKQKEQIIEKLKKVPIVQIACEQIGIGRATYYRWRKDDKDFTQNTDEALDNGRKFINDMAESKLVSAIRDQNMTAIIYWLKHNHPTYTTKIEITNKHKENEELTQEQMEIVKKALELTRGIQPVINLSSKQHDKNNKEKSN